MAGGREPIPRYCRASCSYGENPDLQAGILRHRFDKVMRMITGGDQIRHHGVRIEIIGN